MGWVNDVEEAKGIEAILAACLEALEGGAGVQEVLERYPGYEGELRGLLEATAWMMRQREVVEPRAGFVSASRVRLLERIAREGAVRKRSGLAEVWLGLKASLRGGRRYALQVALAVLMVVCLVVGSSGAALASQEALPGELLYPLKLGLEQVELAVTLDMAGDIRLHTLFSQARLMEIEELVMEGRFNFIRGAVTNFEYHVNEATRLLSRLVRRDPEEARQLALGLEKTLAGQRDLLNLLMAAVPSEVSPELLRAFNIALGGEIALNTVLEEIERLPLSTPSPTQLIDVGSGATATLQSQSSSPTASLSIISTFTPTATAVASASPTPTPTALFTSTATLPPTFTATPTTVPEEQRPTPTYTRRPATSTPVPLPTATPEPKKTKKPLPVPTRRPPKPGT